MSVWEIQVYKTAFGVALAGNMFQWKIDEVFNDMPNIFGITDDILVVGYEDDCRDHDKTFQRLVQQCTQVYLKLNKISVISDVHLSHSLER